MRTIEKESYKPDMFSIVVIRGAALFLIVLGTKKMSDCLASPAHAAKMMEEIGVNPFFFAGFAIIYGCFLMAWINGKAQKGGGK